MKYVGKSTARKHGEYIAVMENQTIIYSYQILLLFIMGFVITGIDVSFRSINVYRLK